MIPRLFMSFTQHKQRVKNIFNITSTFGVVNKRKLYTTFNLFGAHAHKSKFDMDKVYLRHDNNTSELHISFRYTNPNLRIDKDFNFCRKINENIENAFSRIRNNIEKERLKRKKKSTGEPSPVHEIPIEILDVANSDIIKDVTFADLIENDKLKQKLQLRVLDCNYDIVYNQPWIKNLVLPQTCMAGFLVYPIKLEMHSAERAHCLGVWYKSKMPRSGDLERRGDWIVCGEGLVYEPNNYDIGYHLKIVLTPGNGNNEFGPAVESIMKTAVQAGPGSCPFEMRHKFTKDRLKNDELRLVSYNLLADYYADSDYSRNTLFPYCPSYILKMDYRKQLIIKELIGYNADIMCLQEVDVKLFEHDLKHLFENSNFGFKGIMTPKGTCGEGLAIFYRDERFNIIDKFELNIGDNVSKLAEFKELWDKIKDNKPLAERLSDRSTTLQVFK